jgi:hypothetical protein
MIIHIPGKVKGQGYSYIAEVAELEKRCYSTAKVLPRLLRKNISLLSKEHLAHAR